MKALAICAVALSSAAVFFARGDDLVAPWQSVQATLATGERPASQRADLPPDPLIPLPLSGGTPQAFATCQ